MSRSTASALALTILLLVAPTGVAAQATVRLDVRSVEYQSVALLDPRRPLEQNHPANGLTPKDFDLL